MLEITIIGYGRVGASVANGLLAHLQEPFRMNIMDPSDQVYGYWLDTAHAYSGFKPRDFLLNDESAFSKADIVIYTAGTNPKHNKSRLSVVDENVALTEKIFAGIKWQRDPWIIVITNPVDVIAWYVQRFSGLAKGRVLSTGTLLDTHRLRWYIAQATGRSPEMVRTMMLGEHGNTMVPVFSYTTVENCPIADFPGIDDEKLAEILVRTRNAAWEIRETVDATRWGVTACTLEIISAIRNGTECEIALGIQPDDRTASLLGHKNLSLSLPVRIKNGIASVSWDCLDLNEKEWAALRLSAAEIASSI